jgi:excisionase family DNA binding protein
MALKDKYYTISQAAKHVGVTRQTISRWIKEGRLHGERIGRETLIDKEEVNKHRFSWIASGHILRFIYDMRTDYCRKRFGLSDDERLEKIVTRKGKHYMIINKKGEKERSMELPIPMEQYRKEFREHVRPVLASYLREFYTAAEEVLGNAAKASEMQKDTQQRDKPE